MHAFIADIDSRASDEFFHFALAFRAKGALKFALFVPLGHISILPATRSLHYCTYHGLQLQQGDACYLNRTVFLKWLFVHITKGPLARVASLAKVSLYMQTAIFLDANASAPVLPEAKEAFLRALSMMGNASSPHAFGRVLRKQLDESRVAVAAALGGAAKHLYFCSGASEANRWIVDAFVLAGQGAGEPIIVVASPLEHPSLMKPLEAAAKRGEIVLNVLAIDAEGELDLDLPAMALADAVVVTAAHNETGIMPDLMGLCRIMPSKTILVTDASQAVARASKVPERADVVIASAHKMGGIVGAGAFLLRGNARSLPMPWAGGGQEGGVRPGSEAVPLIAAMGAAALQVERVRMEHESLRVLRDDFEAKLLQRCPNARVLGVKANRLSNTSAVVFGHIDGEALRMALDMAGLAVGFGSACSALAPHPSPALLLLGLSPEEARATARFSLTPGDSETMLNEALNRLGGVVAALERAQPKVSRPVCQAILSPRH
jgi:cysteine desulfurase